MLLKIGALARIIWEGEYVLDDFAEAAITLENSATIGCIAMTLTELKVRQRKCGREKLIGELQVLSFFLKRRWKGKVISIPC